MRLAFIYPPYSEIGNQPSIKEVSQNYGVYPPINLAYVAGIAESSGHQVRLIDANAEGLSKENVADSLRLYKPDALLFTVTTYMFHQVLDWIRYLKKEFDIPVIVGGIHVGLYPIETLSHDEIDLAVIGDSEETLPILLQSFEQKKDLRSVEHIAFRHDGKTLVTGKGRCSDFLKGVYPLRSQLQNEKYYEFISQRKNFTAMITSRGCPFRCTCCEQGGKNHMHFREIEDVLDEIKECFNRYDVREIDFFDPVFTVDRKRTIALCQGIASLGLDLVYAVRTRVDCVDDGILRELKRSGCKRIYYGIESSSRRILRRLNKNTDMEKVRKAVDLTKKNGIDTFGYFMLGNDGETRKTMQDTIRFSLSLGLDYAQYNKTVAMAGTEMYSNLIKEIGYDFWAKYTLEKKDPDWIIPKLGTSLRDEEIQEEIAKAYRKFYFRPGMMLKKLGKVRSTDELVRYARAALSFLH